MRPQKVVMSAFGPYAGKVEVNLEELGQSGLYLITGDIIRSGLNCALHIRSVICDFSKIKYCDEACEGQLAIVYLKP